MSNQLLIKPDSKFVKEVIGLGGDSLKKCFQCATCSITCPLSSENKPFPRKEMLWAQWGLKDKLFKSPDIWLCHQCNDCSVYCPREAVPGDVLAALRNYSFGLYAIPGLLGKAFRDIRFLPLLLAVPVALFLILLAATGHLAFPEGQIVFEEFVPHIIVDPVFLVLVGIVLVIMAISLSRFWRDITYDSNPTRVSIIKVIGHSALPKLIELLLHRKFRDCGTSNIKTISHMTIFYGCLAFALVTGSIFIGTYSVGIDLPLAAYHPLKIMANLGAIAVMIGCILVIYRRLRGGKETGNSSYLDWNLILLIFAVTGLGILTEVLRLAELASAAYVVYFIHLVSVFYGIAYFPYSKLTHLLYRSLAVLYADYRERFMIAGKANQEIGV
ncbi:MAG: quinone-interacting membrane-bound oxidoreductase complex subunit QmoC [Dehalococcoidia bacterium]|nr:MAG: quinone-interacting membrane-bound oxidoreductase complex subunit QmoC [Dehalococcoidia bacterium]